MQSPSNPELPLGVRLQRLDKGDQLSEVVLVPPEAEDETSADEAADDQGTGSVVTEDGATGASVDNS